MSALRQRQTVLIFSLALTGLLAGAAMSGLFVWRMAREQLQDADFLRQQLQRVDPENGADVVGTPPALVRVGTAQRKAIQPERPIIGRLVEVRKVTVASEVTGKVIKMPVEEGTPVTGGQTLLAQIDDVWCRLSLERSQAQVAVTEAKLSYERPELERYQNLREGSSISQSELEEKRATVAELEASLAEARAQVQEEQERKARSQILAPFDGTVVTKYAELGEHVSVGTSIVDIVSRGQVDARLMVPESVINQLRVGQELSVHIDPLAEEAGGTVVSITPYGPTASRTFPVRVRLDDRDGELKVGMSVTAVIATGPEREALVVSKDAVLVRPDGSTVWITVPSNDNEQEIKVQPVPVMISARLQREYAIKPETDRGRKLLTAGATVVIEGAERLTPGQSVRIVTLNNT